MAGAPLASPESMLQFLRLQNHLRRPRSEYCTPVDAGFNFTSWLPPPANSIAPILVWNAFQGVDGGASHSRVKEFGEQFSISGQLYDLQSNIHCCSVTQQHDVLNARILHTVQYQETHIANTTTGNGGRTVRALHHGIWQFTHWKGQCGSIVEQFAILR